MFIRTGNWWINAAHIASIYTAPDQCVVIQLSSGYDIRLDSADSREFKSGFDAITKEFDTP